MVDAYQRRKQSTLDSPIRPQGGWKRDTKPAYQSSPKYYKWYGSVILGNVGRVEDILPAVMVEETEELQGMWYWRLYDFRRSGSGSSYVTQEFAPDAYTAMADADATAAAKLGPNFPEPLSDATRRELKALRSTSTAKSDYTKDTEDDLREDKYRRLRQTGFSHESAIDIITREEEYYG